MPYQSKAAKKKKESTAAILDRFVTEIDINMVMCGLSGGIAAYGGLVPPFTRLLMTFNNLMPGGVGFEISKSVDFDHRNVAAFMSPGGMLGSGAGFLFGSILKKQLTESGTPEALAEAQAKTITSSAIFMSGALEAMLMYKEFSNPEVAKAIISAPAEIIKGVGSVVPG